MSAPSAIGTISCWYLRFISKLTNKVIFKYAYAYIVRKKRVDFIEYNPDSKRFEYAEVDTRKYALDEVDHISGPDIDFFKKVSYNTNPAAGENANPCCNVKYLSDGQLG